MQVIYYGQEPTFFGKSLFLAGPSVRRIEGAFKAAAEKVGWKPMISWRKEAIRLLDEIGYDGVVFVPEYENENDPRLTFEQIVEWEDRGLRMSDCILFWIPRKFPELPGLTTDDEFGTWKKSGRIVLGTPREAVKVRYQRHYAQKLGIPMADTLSETIRLAVEKIGPGILREGGLRFIPLSLFRTSCFQSWLKNLLKNKNELLEASIDWASNGLCIAKMVIRIDGENRLKANESVLFRPDISVAVLYRQGRFVLVREFRSPVNNEDGMVWELPGGSSRDRLPLDVVVTEVREETGIAVARERFDYHGVRQSTATLSAHRIHLYSAELTDEEMDTLIKSKGQHGSGAEEKTFVNVCYFDDAHLRNVDWSNLAMIQTVYNHLKNRIILT